ncbi:DNA-binding response regulator [Dyella solisilvae]|uniref:DNA-binding response regulator n=1 Tax=Dyella solisilvae TaxID=1920168 RepID=A0A370K9N2_9GAMM|nr:LytTR family DNA-binding domain-containing protein [Dyella solisilvae]RDI99363.1 DNA-binding response regulator [Dyella solisilvae]
MRVLVVDDEPLARRGIIARLAREEDMTVVGEAADGASAVSAMNELKPDLVFIDIAMPALDGLSAVAMLPWEHRPIVIFVSAFDQFAIQAFQVRALDYLLKPIDDDRFSESVARAKEAWLARPHRSTTPSQPSRFTVRVGAREEVVDIAHVDWIEADGDYATLHLGPRTLLLREPLHKLASRLDPDQFVRIHRSTIVRVSRVAQIQALTNRDAMIRLTDGTALRVSRTYTQALRQALFQFGAS